MQVKTMVCQQMDYAIGEQNVLKVSIMTSNSINFDIWDMIMTSIRRFLFFDYF